MGRVSVAVVGAGLSGLFTASELLGAGIEDLVVVEASPGPGGVVRTVRRDGYTLEAAAGTLMLPHPALDPILDRLGVATVPAEPEAALRHVYTGGKLVALPPSPRAALAPIASWGAKLRAAAEPVVRRGDATGESLADFLRRRLGRGMGESVAWLAASGVFAGDPERLSARSAFPALTALEDEAGSLVRGALRSMRRARSGPRPTSHVPVGGMDAIVQAAAAALGDRLRTGSAVTQVARDGDGWLVAGTDDMRADHVVLAVSPARAAEMVDADLSDLLRRAVTAPVVVVGLGGTPDELPLPRGFGALTGRDSGTATRGILFESSYAPHRAPPGHSLAKVIAGGAIDPGIVESDNTTILETVGTEAAAVLGSDLSPSFVEVVRHTPGIPQYEVGHERWLRAVDSEVDDRAGLHVTGWGYRGVGVSQVAADAAATAERISRAAR